jgi:DNA-binding NarL/FixJ family response regulator
MRSDLLAISMRTVETHRHRVMHKLCVHTLVELRLMAASLGVIALDRFAPARAYV